MVFEIKNIVNPVESSEVLGHSSMCKLYRNMGWLKELFLKNRRLTIHETVGMVKISFGSIQSILQDSLKVLHIAAKFMSGLLIEEQKENLINMCQNVQENTERDKNYLVTYLFSHTLKWHSRYEKSISSWFK